MEYKVSIIIPVYNIEKRKLKQMVKSFVKQSYDNWKLLIVDDGSKKETANYLDYLATFDDRITVIHQENAGCVEARRTGFRAMEGADYIATVDSDDYIPKYALEIMINTAEEYEADLVVGGAKKVIGNLEIPYKPNAFFKTERVYSHTEIIRELLISYFGWGIMPVSVWGKLYDKKFLPILSEGEIVNVFTATDANASLNVIPHVQRLAVVSKPVYCYRTGGGTSKFRSDYMEETLNWYRYRLPFIEKYLSDFSTSGITAYDLMAEELKNETRFHLKRYITSKCPSDEDIVKMIDSFFEVPEITEAFCNHTVHKGYIEYNEYMKEKNSAEVLRVLKAEVYDEKKKNRYKNLIKSILEKV